eukprot:GHVN01101687.1.p2 GENE.GHVN01101687.1~~GHVN01101687.1.p2  ORF type:complete len:114 (+),score=13.25 GHVN01101687.1:968-1309(+)
MPMSHPTRHQRNSPSQVHHTTSLPKELQTLLPCLLFFITSLEYELEFKSKIFLLDEIKSVFLCSLLMITLIQIHLTDVQNVVASDQNLPKRPFENVAHPLLSLDQLHVHVPIK